MFCCATANLLQQLICRRGIQPIRPRAPRLAAALSRRMVLTAWLVGSYIGRAKLPSSRLVRRTWLLPNTPRRVRQPLPGRPRQAANRPPQKQVGARYRLISRTAAWLTALGCRHCLLGHHHCKLARARARTSTILCSGSTDCSKMCFPASKQATQALLALVFEPFYHYCTVHFLLLRGCILIPKNQNQNYSRYI